MEQIKNWFYEKISIAYINRHQLFLIAFAALNWEQISSHPLGKLFVVISYIFISIFKRKNNE